MTTLPRPVPTDWLLDSDPAIRWQVMRDLLDAPPDAVAAERSRVAHEGWGAQLLSARDPDGQWLGGACFPGRGERDPGGAQPWTATLPVLMELRDLGLDPDSPEARVTVTLVAQNCRWEYDGAPFFDGEVEACINGRALNAGAYFGADVGRIVRFVLGDQLGDGGWNCYVEQCATVSSFASTLCVLEGLLEYERATGAAPEFAAEISAARARGEEYLLRRSLFTRASTGAVVDEAWLRPSFPPRWRYDVLRALEYFRAADVRDDRLGGAVEVVRGAQGQDGTWPADRALPGAAHVRYEDADGRPSRWNTLRSARVLRWWDATLNQRSLPIG